MTSEMIEKFVEGKGRKDAAVNIHFKERSTITGLFIRTADYGELKMKKPLARRQQRKNRRMEQNQEPGPCPYF